MSAKGIKKLLLVGNPNVGKSVIFGRLTGKYATVSNYPGTTVELSLGNTAIRGVQYVVTDTPGVNSLLPMSEDEQVTRDILLKEEFDTVVQVADTKNLRRSLVISLQLSEMGIPFVMALNMADEADNLGITTDFAKLSALTGVETISTVATRNKGVGRLKDAIQKPMRSKLEVIYGEEVESALKEMEPLLPDARISRRSLALMLLGGDTSLKDWLHSKVDDSVVDTLESIVQKAQAASGDPLGYVINRARLEAMDAVVDACQVKTPGAGQGFRQWLGAMTMHPLWGIPVLFVVLYLMFEFVGRLGAGTLVDFMESVVFGRYINPYCMKFFLNYLPIQFLQEIIVGKYGILTMAVTYSVAIVLPITGTFFIAFGILEDSGYLPRLA
ncbi:MAG: FeoB small GTPase domain-containing protein, partial [Nitrospirota bacterium]